MSINDKQLQQAREMIMEFILSKFEEIKKRLNPHDPYLLISFHKGTNMWFYTSLIDDWNEQKESPYPYDVIYKATEIANEYGITGSCNGSGCEITFCLYLW